ncbi:hypothetical protein Trisim1_000672 [Trichoderma cf. simile WF8]
MNVGMLIAGRVIGGIGNGINTSTTPVYHAETSKTSLRGQAILGELFVLNIGWTLAQFVTLAFSFTSGGIQWRFPTAVQILYLLPVFFLLPFFPDSPRWLASKGHLQKAEEVLSRVLDEDQLSPTFQVQFQELQRVVELEIESSRVRTSNLLKDEGQNMYRFLIACSAQLLGQLSGVNVIAYYIVILFVQQLHLEPTLARVLAACCGFVLLSSNLASQQVIEKWGRRKLLILGGCGQAICFLISSISLATGGNSKWGGITVVAMIYLYCFVFAFAWQSIPYLYPAEIISLKYRARLFPIANGANWAVNYAIVLITPVGLANIGWKFYIIFMVFNIIAALVAWFFYVETARKSLEEVDLMFVGDNEVKRADLPPYLRLKSSRGLAQNALDNEKQLSNCNDITKATFEHKAVVNDM